MYISYDIYKNIYYIYSIACSTVSSGSVTTQLNGSIQTFIKENLLFTSINSRQTLYGKSKSQ